MGEYMIEARDVAKAYGGKTIFQGVSLGIAAGQAVALLGHNGSGKTTLLKILAGLIRQTAGSIHRAPGLRFGYVPEYFPKMNLKAAQYIRHMGRIEGMAGADIISRSAALFEAFYMDHLLDVPMKNLSKGTLQKVGVVQALLGERDVLLLDEPLSGQDMASQKVFVREVLERKRQGTTVLLSCHEPYLVRRLADAAYTFEKGRLIPVSMEGDAFAGRDILTFTNTPEGGTLPSLPDGAQAQAEHGGLTVRVHREQSNEVIVRFIQAGYTLKEMHNEEND